MAAGCSLVATAPVQEDVVALVFSLGHLDESLSPIIRGRGNDTQLEGGGERGAVLAL